MPTFQNARENYVQSPIFFRRKIIFSENGIVSLGFVAAQSVIRGGEIAVRTAFNSGTLNTISVGLRFIDGTTQPAVYTSAQSLTTPGIVNFNAMATSAFVYTDVDAELIATINQTGTASTTGEAYILVNAISRMGRRL